MPDTSTFESTFEALPAAATLVDRHGVVVDVNQAFLDYAARLGRQVTKADRVGRHVTEFAPRPEDRPRVGDFVEQLLRHGGTRDVVELTHSDAGRPRYTRVRGSCVVRDGAVDGAVILREDVTVEVLQAQRVSLGQRLRDEIWRMRGAHDMERILVLVGDGLRRFGIPFGDCGVNIVNPERTSVLFHSLTAEGAWIESSAESGVNLVLDFWRRGEVVYRRDLEVEDLYGEAEDVRGIFRRPVRCIIDVPFSHGTLALNSAQPEAFTAADIELLSSMAVVLSEAYERIADLEALQRSEERYRTVVSQSADAILLVDHERKIIVETNPAAQRLLGYTEAELAGRSVFDLVAHEPSSIEDNAELALRRGQHSVGERTYRHRDGHLIDVEVGLSRIDAAGPPMVCAVARDVSARKRTERRRAGLQRLREEVWRMQTGQDIDRLLDVARDCLRDMGVEFDHFGINLVRPASANPVRIYTRGAQPMRAPDSDERALSTIVEWWRARRPVYRGDLRRDDPYSEAEVLRAVYGHEVRTILDVPFSHGTVAVNSRHPDAFDDDDVACLQALAETLSDGFRRTDDLARLAQQREYLAVTLRSIGDGVIATDEAGRVQLMNAAAERLTGWSQGEAVGRDLTDVFRTIDEDTGEPQPNPVAAVMRQGEVLSLPVQTVLLARDGSRHLLADSAAPIRGGDDIVGVVLVFQDVSAQRQAERERERAARLESVGLLAGGIAHDFNNILTGITGNLSLARFEIGGDERVAELLASAESAAQRASRLTGQLLTFARGGAPVRRSIDVDEVAREAADFALRGSNVGIEYDLPADLWPVHGDPNQLGQVVQNLVINADQAMPDGGRIQVSGANLQAPPPALAPGRYVCLRVRDQGHGIEASVRERIFEPYFTTKETGSGLGLATVYAIVRQHDGDIEVESEPGRGTTFALYLPAADGAPERRTGAEPDIAAGRGQRVLVMDDEDAVRRLMERALTRLGYQAHTTADGAEAVRACEQALASGQAFDLAILDLTVPGGMGGVQALEQLRRLDPELRAIVSSGYSNDPIVADPAAHGFQGMLPKPYRIGQLARVLSEVLA